MDGNIVAIAVASNEEIWVAVHSVAALFGFNLLSNSWDRTVRMSVAAGMSTTLDATQVDTLTLNGTAAQAPGNSYQLEVINTSSGTAHLLSQQTKSHVAIGTSEELFVDDHGNMGKLSLLDGTSVAVAATALASNTMTLVPDSAGHVWFATMGYKTVGVGRLDLTTGNIALFSLPAVHPGTGPAPACGAAECIPPDAVFDPGIQTLVVDDKNDVWVVTTVAGSTNGSPISFFAPVFKLIPS
jgi:xanthine/uracil/vitamin C permease (AzgA family)